MKTLVRLKNAILYKIGVRFPYSKIRVFALRKLGHHVGQDVYFPSDLTITQNFANNRGRLYLGNRVSIGPKCIIILTSHPNASRLRNYYGTVCSSTTIEDDVWIGAGSIILPNISIGKCSIIGSGSVVTKSVPPNTIVAGNPARGIKKISSVQYDQLV